MGTAAWYLGGYQPLRFGAWRCIVRLLRQIPSSHGTHLEPGIIFLVRLSKLLVELMAPHLPIEFGPLQDLGRENRKTVKDA